MVMNGATRGPAADVPPDLIREFDYRPHRLGTLFGFFLACAGTVVMACLAIWLEGPLDAGAIELSETQARILFGVLAALSPIGLICLGATVYVAFARDRRVAITESLLILPRPTAMGLSCDEIQIPLASIRSTGVHDFIGSSKVLRIEYESDAIHIPSNMLQNKKTFGEMVSVLLEAIERNQTGEAL